MHIILRAANHSSCCPWGIRVFLLLSSLLSSLATSQFIYTAHLNRAIPLAQSDRYDARQGIRPYCRHGTPADYIQDAVDTRGSCHCSLAHCLDGRSMGTGHFVSRDVALSHHDV